MMTNIHLTYYNNTEKVGSVEISSNFIGNNVDI